MSVSQQPTAFEQLTLELINELRMAPAEEFAAFMARLNNDPSSKAQVDMAISYFGVNMTAVYQQMAGYNAVAPLAWNANLAQAAETHSVLMRQFDTQSHQLPGEASLGARITAAGYTGWTTLRENVFAYTMDAVHGHAGFVIDWGYDSSDWVNGSLRSNWRTNGDGVQDPAGHRVSMLSASVTEIGIGVIEQTNPAAQTGPYLMTQNFGNRSGYQAQMLGVVMNDLDGDDFYDIGEGLGGITITATGLAGTFTTTSWSAGGYQMVVPAGQYTVTFSGGALGGVVQKSVTMGTQNLKVDAWAEEAVAASPINRTGSTEGEVLDGGFGADILIGAGGVDRIAALDSDDWLVGDRMSAIVDPVVAGQVFRLYQATLDRAPDLSGYLNWMTRIFVGEQSLLQVASGFMQSQEFRSVYGTLDNTAFVTLLYDNVLNRAPDSGGLATWTGQLANGMSRAQVIVGFSESQEFRQSTAATESNFATSRNEQTWSDDVFRLYQAALDRAPDLAGFTHWTNRLSTGSDYLGVAGDFVNGAEFQQRYGSLGNSDFVEQLYNNVLDRASDAQGKAHWLANMDNGMTRTEVLRGFAQSAEFRTNTEAPLEAWMRANTADDVLTGGKGADRLVGGGGSDCFVFSPADAGGGAVDRVLDLEAWDCIDLTAFGFTNDAQARSHFTQQGADVVFSHSGVQVVFQKATLSMFDDDMLVV